MSENKDAAPAPRRFYKAVRVQAVDGGHAVMLDSRSLRTPARSLLVAPTEAMGRLLAAEWEAQGEVIALAAMPATRLAYTAIDRVAGAREAVAAEVARYAGSDLLCYFAEEPEALVERQLHHWGPVLEWAETALDIHLIRTVGISPQEQPAASLLRAARLADHMSDFALAGLAHAAALYGSALLAFALAEGELGGETAFDLSRLDEAFQAERWGLDEEAQRRTEAMRAEAVMLDAWFEALG
jgi:chaperone required for assembly of F1-ATPase